MGEMRRKAIGMFQKVNLSFIKSQLEFVKNVV